MAMKAILLALPVGALSQSVSSCGGASDHLKDVKISISPDPVQRDQAFSITMTGNLDAALDSFNTDVDLQVQAMGIVHEPVKGHAPFTISPAIPAGAQSLTIGPLTLPNLPGSAEATGTVKLTNSKKEPVACIKLNMKVPAFTSEESPAVEEGSSATKLSVCAGASDHLHNLKWSTASDVTTVAGTLDEAVAKFTINTDLTLKLGFIHKKIDLAIPVSYSPGFQKGDIKITAGPPSGPGSLLTSTLGKTSVTGTVKVVDGASSEITCLSLDPAMQVVTNNTVIV